MSVRGAIVEFMTMNVRRAMACMFQHPDKVDALPELETKAGSAIARLSALRNRQVMLTVAYDTEQRGTELPFMELIFTPLKDGAHLRR